jgi:hypothetical protein
MINEVPKCPKCGSKDLLRQNLPDGQLEIICLNLDCDYTVIRSDSGPSSRDQSKPMSADLPAKSPAQLKQLAKNLNQSVGVLTGRSSRLARRQLAFVRSELRRFPQNNTLCGG